MKVGIIGTGLMGFPMAINIAKKFKLKSFNRTFDRMKGLEKHKIVLCKSLRDLCKDTDVIISMLPGDKEVLKTVEKVKKFIKPGSIFIDMSSTKVSTAKKCYNTFIKIRSNFIDAPVSGGPEGAKSASLAIMAGGKKSLFLKIKKILQTMGRPILVGPNGSGQVSKLCNQIIVGVTIGGVAEALVLCEKNRADPKKFIKAVSGGFADSKVLQNHGQRMIQRDFRPRGKNVTHLKDMQNILQSAKKNNLKLPVSKIIYKMFNSLCIRGLSNYDHASLYMEIKKINKLS